MVGFQDIHGLGEGSAELLEAAGFTSPRDLARAEVAELASELRRANEVLKILKKTPAVSQIERWVQNARELTGEEPSQADGEEPESVVQGTPDDREVNFEADPVVSEMLGNAPLAIPVPATLMMENDIGVADVVSGVMLTRVHGDIEIRVDTRRTRKEVRNPLERKSDGNEVARETAPEAEPPVRRRIDVSRMRSIDDVRREGNQSVPQTVARHRGPMEEVRTPSPELNRGKNPNSRGYIRGVLHPHPGRMKLAAVVTLLVMIATPLAIIAASLLLLSVTIPDQFEWVPGWLLAFPVVLPLLGVLFLIFSLNAQCRICNQRLYFRRRCHKHQKAHHVPLLGYAFPMSLHLLSFHWFRCTYCGTAVRLKK